MLKFVKPAREGLILRDHKNKFRQIPAEGAEIEWDATWARRVRDGDAVIAEPPAPAPKIDAKAAAAAEAEKQPGLKRVSKAAKSTKSEEE